ncbi:MAG TPA: PSD1 and planctomycete cytochrome C domain-containing protein [Gemmataceae bacterium]|jgi:mono/diheme cytochrome c family protein|nr:PSD1 and planctomycete cytochrome C domain-containing protein [Gemmataceae bacterium]
MRSAAITFVLIAASAQAADTAFFEAKVRPVLVTYCVKCHGPDKQKGGLRLDSAAGWQTGGANGPAIKPGSPEESLLITVISRTDDKTRMPPGGKLSGPEIAALTRWIKEGAVAPVGPARVGGMTLAEAQSWWAFQPIKRPAAPRNAADNPIDAFIQSKLAARKATLSPPADRRTLIRRATYDLIGLPPTAEEVEAFEKDTSPDPFARLVDRLLASPHYGERWGRHWLDLVRYADSAGENSDHPLPHAWRYRNWVIDAFNADKPYDEFIREQLAGDILAVQGPPGDYASRIIATGFLAVARRFGHDIDKDMHLTHEDTIDTIGKTLLGLTLGCARCHDHKYDPLSSKDYYALYGVFDSTKYAYPGCEFKQQPRDLVPLATPTERLRGVFIASARTQQVAYAVTEGRSHDVKVQAGGDPEKPGSVVPRRWLEVLGGQPLSGGSGRLELANRIVARDNPLTARVMANRIWLHHFGRGLVESANDFGVRGSPATHPELLDWLATEFIESGWSIKALHRRIMLSATYQQASASRPDLSVDPKNEFYARFNRRRLSAEELRDSLLLVSGQLDRTPAGPHPFPPESAWNFTQHVPFASFYETDKRSVYLIAVRNRRHPFLGLFDGADPNATTPQRQTTTVPTQALYFLNDPFFHAQAEKIARRALAKADEVDRLNELFVAVLQRPPTNRERDLASGFLSRYTNELATAGPDKTVVAWSALARIALASNEFLYLD